MFMVMRMRVLMLWSFWVVMFVLVLWSMRMLVWVIMFMRIILMLKMNIHIRTRNTILNHLGNMKMISAYVNLRKFPFKNLLIITQLQ